MSSTDSLTTDACAAAAEVVLRGGDADRLDVRAFTEAVGGAHLDLVDGLRIQRQVLEHHRRHGEALAGWKVGLTSGTARDKMGVGFRPFGHILKRRTFAADTPIPLASVPRAGLEPELGFLFGSDLAGPEVTAEDVRDAIDHVIPTFEIQQQRIDGAANHGIALADNLSHWGVVLGEPSTWRGTAGATVVELQHPDGTVHRAGPGFAIDEPVESLAELAKMLHQHGQRIQAGQFIITGAFLKVPVETTGVWQGRFSTAGALTVRFV